MQGRWESLSSCLGCTGSCIEMYPMRRLVFGEWNAELYSEQRSPL
jgi:hypothetical protein